MSCRVCENSGYIGETKGALKQWVKEQWDSRGIEKNHVAIHFNQDGHKSDDLQVEATKSVKGNNLSELQIRGGTEDN